MEPVPEEADDEECELPMLRYSRECFENVGMKSSRVFAGSQDIDYLVIVKVLKIGEVIVASLFSEIN